MAGTLVQLKTKTFTGGTSTTLTLDAAPTTGNVLILTWGTSNSTADASTPTGGGCTTWTKQGESSTRRSTSIWTGIVDTTPSANVVMPGTVTMSFTVTEWSGLDSGGTLVQGSAQLASASGTVASGANSTITPTSSTDVVLIASFGIQSNTSSGPTAGWTDILAFGTIHAASYRVVTSASGAYTNKYGIASDFVGWDSVCIAFNVAAAGTPAVASRGIHAL